MKRWGCLMLCLALIALAMPARGGSARRPDTGAPAQIDPPYDFDPDAMLPRDFGAYFEADHDTQAGSYPLLAGTEWENTVVTLRGRQDGPALYVIAGVHGGEAAAWLTGNLLKKISLKAGALHILSPANRWGAAAEPRSRYVTGNQDLNRSFPGDPGGTAAQRIAHAILEDVKAVRPAFVFDLHEAATNVEGRDFLGRSLIYTSLAGMEDMYLDLLMETQTGTLTSMPFDFFSPGPEGSVNHTVTTRLHIPVITVETYRGDPMATRIADQLAVVQFVLRHYGLVD